MRILLLLSTLLSTSHVHAQFVWEATSGPPLVYPYSLTALQGHHLIATYAPYAYHSSNSGTTWRRLSLPSSSQINSPSFVTDYTGAWFFTLMSLDSAIAKSTDAGASWSKIRIGANLGVQGNLKSDVRGWVYTVALDQSLGSSYLLLSQDGGSNWEGNPISVPDGQFFSLLMVEANSRVWLAYYEMNQRRICYSDDHGASWRKLEEIQMFSNLIGLFRTSRSTLFSFGRQWRAGRSTDDGLTWQLITEATGAAGMVEDTNGILYATSDVINVIRSTDDGLTWEAANDGLPHDYPQAIVMDEDGRLFVALQNQPVYRVRPQSAVRPRFQQGALSVLPHNLKLTSISGAILSAALYDLLGRQVCSASGIGSLELSTSGLPAGVYIVRVNDGGEVWQSKVLIP